MNKKGFTLMELLLVVAVLAIVAAAAAPAFFGGATDAVNEAKRSQFLSAYSNTLSGANMHIAIMTSQGNTPTTATLAASMTSIIPDAARTFNNGTTDKVLTAQLNNNVVEIYSDTTKVTAAATWDIIKTY